jgi:hypothetical protein
MSAAILARSAEPPCCAVSASARAVKSPVFGISKGHRHVDG